MKKSVLIAAASLLVAASAFSSYIVVLKDGTQYTAKAKWQIIKGKAIFILESNNGQAIQLDPSLIDVAKSEQATKMGLTNANIIDLNPNLPESKQNSSQTQSNLGGIHLRKLTPGVPAPTAATASVPPPASTGTMPSDVMSKFELAYDNIGIFEKSIKSTGAHSLRAELTLDTEERVFNAISATSFLIVKNAGVANANIEMVELFMKTTNGGSAGRFQMTRADAEALDARTMSQQDYFVRHVIY
jgi:hypothetical protein